MNNKHIIITAIFLLIGSFNLLTLAFVYYQLEGEVVNYRYSDEEEFGSVQEGIDFIDKMPIQFNITNEYFSNFDNLEEFLSFLLPDLFVSCLYFPIVSPPNS